MGFVSELPFAHSMAWDYDLSTSKINTTNTSYEVESLFDDNSVERHKDTTEASP